MRLIRYRDDKRILQRIKENDRTVLGELYVKYERVVYSTVIKQGGRTEDAQDVLQEAIIILWQKVCEGDFKLDSKLATYVTGIAVNVWRGKRRKSSRLVFNDDYDEMESPEPDALHQVMDNDRMQIIWECMDRISELCRKLLVMFYFEGRNMTEIAGLLNLANPDVAKSRKYQCKKALQKELAVFTPEQDGRL